MPLIEGKREERVIPAEARGASLTFTVSLSYVALTSPDAQHSKQVLKAGANTNSVPDLATLRFDRRLVPSETLEEARAQLQSVLDEVANEIPEIDYTYHEDYSTEPVWVDENLEICKTWAEAVETVLEKKAGIVCSPGSEYVYIHSFLEPRSPLLTLAAPLQRPAILCPRWDASNHRLWTRKHQAGYEHFILILYDTR